MQWIRGNYTIKIQITSINEFMSCLVSFLLPVRNFSFLDIEDMILLLLILHYFVLFALFPSILPSFVTYPQSLMLCWVHLFDEQHALLDILSQLRRS